MAISDSPRNNDVSISVRELERNAPVPVDRNRPKPLSIAFQQVKAITRDIHVFNDDGGIQCGQLHAQFRGVCRLYTPGGAGVKELLQPLVLE